MFELKKYDAKYNHEMYVIYKNFRDEEDLFFDFDEKGFEGHLFASRAFQPENCLLAFKGDELVGYGCVDLRAQDDGKEGTSGFIHTFIVKKEYRRQGVGSMILNKLEEMSKARGRASVRCVFVGGVNWPWYIPHTEHHMHPGMPCVQMNSEFYIFLYHHHYFVNSIHEGFHLPLAQYDMPAKVKAQMEENKKHGLVVEIYDPAKHHGIEEFCQKIEKDNGGFAHSIRYNLEREKPLPFVVAAHDGKVCGWTGAMYVESTGRGHLDGIIVDPDERGSGLGKGLFCTLCTTLKGMGASYMTFFTGLDNPARYIYMGAGFQIAQSFADMKKNL